MTSSGVTRRGALQAIAGSAMLVACRDEAGAGAGYAALLVALRALPPHGEVVLYCGCARW